MLFWNIPPGCGGKEQVPDEFRMSESTVKTSTDFSKRLHLDGVQDDYGITVSIFESLRAKI